MTQRATEPCPSSCYTPASVKSRCFNLCLLGFGNVNRALVELLCSKRAEMREHHGIDWRITGIASRRLGWLVKPDGFDAAALNIEGLAGEKVSAQAVENLAGWLNTAQPNVLFEATSLNVETGEPAISRIRAALNHGAHAITANKGPIVHAYRDLRDLAALLGRCFLFESTVMDGAPVFSLFRESLPAVNVSRITGILNSTTNIVLTGMEQGLGFEQSLRKAQDLGIAETDPSYDIDGWDATMKLTALVNVILDVPLRPQQVQREGIRALTGDKVRRARADGQPYKLVCRAERHGDEVHACVKPEQVPLTDPLGLVSGTSSIVRFETDVLPGFTLTEENPGVETTAYGMLSDFIHAAKVSDHWTSGTRS